MRVSKRCVRAAGQFVVFALCLVLLMAVSVAEAALVSHYTLDGIATDAEGVQDGIFNGSPATVAGKIGTAISFNAGIADQTLRTQNMSVSDPGGAHTPAELTLSAWVNTTDTGAYRGLVDKIENSYGALLDINSGTARLVTGPSGGVSPSSLAPVNDGAWHLITGTYAGGMATLYVDGVLQESQAGGYAGNSGAALHIAGDVPVSSTWALDGTVDDVGLWSNALTAGEVGALYSLANTPALNYHLGYAQQVFDVHLSAGSADVNGLTWSYTTGLSGALGEVVDMGSGIYEIKLNTNGTGVTTGTPVLPAPTVAALISHWKLDDGVGVVASDSVDSNDGTLGPQGLNVGSGAWNYTAPDWVAGKIGGALEFSGGTYPGPGDAVMVPDAANLNALSFSVSTWAKTTQTANYVGYVTKGWGANVGDPGGWEIDTNEGVRAQIQSEAPSYAGTTSTPIADDDWHSIVVTYNDTAGTLSMYVDGALIDSVSASPGLTVKDIMFGGDGYSSLLFDGRLDDIGYWDGTLTGGQAMSLFGLGDNAALNYDLGKAQQLWDLHAAGTGSVEIDGLTWYATSGLSDGLGVVAESNGVFSLQLDANGGGVTTVPEPTVIVLLILAGMAGLLRRSR